jgi:hypothetical protein
MLMARLGQIDRPRPDDLCERAVRARRSRFGAPRKRADIDKSRGVWILAWGLKEGDRDKGDSCPFLQPF